MHCVIARLILIVLLSKFSVVMADSLDIAKINQPSLSLTTHLGVLEDVDKTLTLEDVQKEGVHFKNDFQGSKSINLSYTKSAYWLRLSAAFRTLSSRC